MLLSRSTQYLDHFGGFIFCWWMRTPVRKTNKWTFFLMGGLITSFVFRFTLNFDGEICSSLACNAWYIIVWISASFAGLFFFFPFFFCCLLSCHPQAQHLPVFCVCFTQAVFVLIEILFCAWLSRSTGYPFFFSFLSLVGSGDEYGRTASGAVNTWRGRWSSSSFKTRGRPGDWVNTCAFCVCAIVYGPLCQARGHRKKRKVFISSLSSRREVSPPRGFSIVGWWWRWFQLTSGNPL